MYRTPVKPRNNSIDSIDDQSTKIDYNEIQSENIFYTPSDLSTIKCKKIQSRFKSSGKKPDKKNVVKNFVKAFLSHL